MIGGMYSAATALAASQVNQDAIAENLAHANVPGYRRQGVTYETFEQALQQAGGTPPDPGLAGTGTPGVYTDFSPGALQHTGNPLDVAAVGNTYFVVDGPDGPLLTRNGAFQLNARNQLQTAGGLLVRGEGGSVTIPNEAGTITITQDGRVLADGLAVGRLQLTAVADPSGLQRVGTTLFRGGNANTTPAAGSVRVEQGYREGSNVQVVHEMVAMLLGLRHHEAADRALKALGDAVALNTQPRN